MTSEQIRYSLETNELKLDNWGKFIHYGISFTMFWISLIFMFIYIGILFIVVPFILGLLFYRIQRNRLKFKVVVTKLTKDKLAEVIVRVSESLNWNLEIIEDNFVVAKTNPNFLSGSWGERITILFDRNKVLVNSICDPDKKGSIISMGRNKRNENTLIEEILKCEKKNGS